VCWGVVCAGGGAVRGGEWTSEVRVESSRFRDGVAGGCLGREGGGGGGFKRRMRGSEGGGWGGVGGEGGMVEAKRGLGGV